jgi:tricorn protease
LAQQTTVNFTSTSSAAEREPAWSPTGESIAYFSDADGEYALYVRDAAGRLPATRIPMDRPGVFYQPIWSPDGKRVAFIDKFRALGWVDLETKRRGRVEAIVDKREPYLWTPDSRGLVFVNQKPTYMRELAVYSLDSGTVRPLTHPIGDASQPAFSHDGRYLFFLGSTNSGQTKSWGDLSVIPLENQVTWSVYAVLLHAGDPAPFLPIANPGTAAAPESGRDTRPIDWQAADRRIVRLPLQPSRYTDLRSAADRSLFVRELRRQTKAAPLRLGNAASGGFPGQR